MRDEYSVYVVELDESKRKGTPNPAVYVGQTARTPEERLAQHLRHEKSSRHVRGHAVRLRPDLYEEHNPLATRAEAEAKEAWLADHLRAQGYEVYSS
jgi:predicted GIY-YIG superfamily endonuclease